MATSALPSPVAVPSVPSRYFINAPVDTLFVGGASLLFYLLIVYVQGGARTPVIYETAAALAWVVNWPHFSATAFRLYGARANLKQYPITATLSPIIVTALVACCFAFPQTVAPNFVKLFFYWSSYHFSGQTIGISLLYARRGQHKVSPWERFGLQGWVYGTFLLSTIRSETSTGERDYYGIKYAGLGLPDELVKASAVFMWGCCALWALLILIQVFRDRKPPPLLYLIPSVAQFVWFVPGGLVPGFSEFVPFFHSLQYIVIAWAMQLKERADRSETAVDVPFLARESALWYAINLAGGATMFWALPHLAKAAGVQEGLAMGVVIAGVQIHHFFVDGVIWKLRAQAVVSPLLANIPQLLRRPAVPQGALT